MQGNNRLILFLAVLVTAGFLFIGTQDTNAQDRCRITIEKVSDPADDTQFDFTVTGDLNFGFTLSDPSDTNEIFNLIVPNDGEEVGRVTVTEQLPSGWFLEGIECTEGFDNCGEFPCLRFIVDEDTNSIMAECRDVDTGTCTFSNKVLIRPIPTMSQWGMIALAAVFVLVGIWAITRKKAQA